MRNRSAHVFFWSTSRVVAFCLLAGGAVVSRADIRYVAQGGQTPEPNYTNWTTAASNIQDAIDVAAPSDMVLVSNGTYQVGGVTNRPVGTVLTNRVAIDKAITVRSANNDPANTIIKGAWDPATNGPAAVRCVYMTNGSALIGFTLTNGATLAPGVTGSDGQGGGGFCIGATLSNCVIAGNSSEWEGGGTYGGPSGNYSFQYDCTYAGNVAKKGTGGAANRAKLYNCLLIGNRAPSGAGAVSSILSNCTVHGNSGGFGGSDLGGGVYSCTLYNCTVSSNSAFNGGGGRESYLYNCLVVGNYAVIAGGLQMGALYNCTVVGNHATVSNGGAAGQAGPGYNDMAVVNSIVYFNSSPLRPNAEWAAVTWSCTTPEAVGTGNITNDPTFVLNGSNYGLSHIAGNYRLRVNSPCIDMGTNGSWTTGAKDLGGNMRIWPKNGKVDMGAYEFSAKGTTILLR